MEARPKAIDEVEDEEECVVCLQQQQRQKITREA